MNEIEIVLLLLLVVAALTPLARTLRVPYPILLVLGGLVLALLPFLPNVELTPDIVLLLFLPPLVYSAAFTTSIRDFRALIQPILSLAIGLVLLTTAAVAVVLHALMPQLGWPLAFAFGAIVSPPDAVAAAAVFRTIGVPRTIVTLLESESLVNDATALIAYRAAIGSVAVAFSASDAGFGFAIVGVGGIAVGLVLAFVIDRLQQRLSDTSVEITVSLLTPFATYIAAESLGFSGVLATVTAGLFFGWRSSFTWSSEARVRGRAVWEIVEFLLNGLVFILIGLQLSSILPSLVGRSMLGLIGLGLAVSVTVIVVRIAWVFGDSYLRAYLSRFRIFRRLRWWNKAIPASMSWRKLLVVGWSGMRGVVSLAVVLALPEGTPERNILIFLTFFVILATLVGQGLTLPLLVRVLGLNADGGAAADQEMHARLAATEAAQERLVQLRDEWPAHLPLIDSLQSQYEHRLSHYTHTHDGVDGVEDSEPINEELLEHHQIRQAVITAERTAVLDLRKVGAIDDDVWRRIEQDFDLEELRMDA